MESLFKKLRLICDNEGVMLAIRQDISILSNHFVCYHSLNLDFNLDTTARVNELFLYPQYESFAGVSKCVSQDGPFVLFEIVCEIDPILQPDLDHIHDYVSFYVTADIPFTSD